MYRGIFDFPTAQLDIFNRERKNWLNEENYHSPTIKKMVIYGSRYQPASIILMYFR